MGLSETPRTSKEVVRKLESVTSTKASSAIVNERWGLSGATTSRKTRKESQTLTTEQPAQESCDNVTRRAASKCNVRSTAKTKQPRLEVARPTTEELSSAVSQHKLSIKKNRLKRSAKKRKAAKFSKKLAKHLKEVLRMRNGVEEKGMQQHTVPSKVEVTKTS